MPTKICSKCKINKSFNEYFKDNLRKIGIRCKCKTCCNAETIAWREKNRSEYNNYAAAWRAKNPDKQHASEIKRRYGLTKEQYNQRLIDQNQKCAICCKSHKPNSKRGRLYVDHCKKTGAIRGLLCGACNSGLGYFEHKTVYLQAANAYLCYTNLVSG